MVENITKFWEIHIDGLPQIPKMTPKDIEYYMWSYNKCIKRDWALEHQTSKLCEVCNEVVSYIDTLFEELYIQPLEVIGYILTRNQCQVKLEENHMKKKMDLNQLEGMDDDALELFMINPTKFISIRRDSMFHIDYKMHLSVDLSMDLEIEVEGPCSMKCIEIYDRMK